MKTTVENNKLTVFLEGRIDTNNAAQTEKDIFDAIGNSGSEDIIFDAEKLEYISSAGLRVLLKVQKTKDKPIPIINVSRDVYDIFETTGFTELLDVRKAYRKVSIEGMTLIGKGLTGDVYRMDNETVLKVFRPNISFDMLISKENEKARNAFVAGVPTAIPYDIVKVGDCYGTVYEMLDAKDLVTIIAEDKEHLDDHIKNFSKTVKAMHSIKVDKFGSQKKEALAALPMLSSALTEDEMKMVRDIYESVPERDTFIHGDCHIGNVMIRDGEMMFIDLATAGMGHPIFDMGSMHSLFCDRANDPKAIAASPVLCRFTQDEIRRIWSVFIGTYLDTDDEEFIKKATRQIAVLSLARRLFMVVAMPGMLSPEAFAAMKQGLTALYGNGMGEICF